MENTTKKADDVVEAVTDLTIPDIKTLDFIVDTCLTSNMFADESVPVVKDLSTKLKKLIQVLDSAS
jgi:hypothetical protein